MSILRYELAKIFRRRVVLVTLVAFLCLNLYNLSRCDFLALTPEDRAIHDAQQTIIHSMEGPFTDDMAAGVMNRLAELESGTGSKEYLSGSADWELRIYKQQVSQLYTLYDYQNRYDRLSSLIDARLEALAGSDHSFEIRRLELMQRTYSARAITGYYDTYSFDEYYVSYDFSLLLLLLMLMIGLAPLFSSEEECGMQVLLRTTRNGRARTVACKLAAAWIFTVVCALLLFGMDLLFFQCIYPFDMLHAPIYSTATFWNTPLNTTVGGFILLNWAAKIGGFTVVALVIALLSALLRNSHAVFFCSLAYSLCMMALGDSVLLLNPLSLVTFESRINEFQTISVGGYPVTTVTALAVAMLLMGGLLVAAIFRVQTAQRQRRPALHLRHKMRWLRGQTGHAVRRGGEGRKVFLKQKMALVIALVLLLKVGLCLSDRPAAYFSTPSEQAEYAAIVQQYGGEHTADFLTFYQDEQAYQAADTAALTGLLQQYSRGQLTWEQYAAQTDAYVPQATVSNAVWERLSADYTYVAADSAHRWLADTRGWAQLLGNRSFDVLAVFLVIAVSGTLFSFEWESGMADLLRTNRRGRVGLALTKILLAFGCTAVLWALFEGIAFGVAASRCDLIAQWHYPAQTWAFFGNATHTLTIGQVYLYTRLLRLLGLLVVQAIAMALSVGTRKSLTSVFTVTGLVLTLYFLFKNKAVLYTLPNPVGLLMGDGFLALPSIGTVQWMAWLVAGLAVAGLSLFAVCRFTVTRKGRRMA